ncbi:MAG: S8 family serine peptidase [Chloroflexi bacterium]|nr:S8 family serine peptidase [Chloroflexota bacterium]
MKSAKLQKKPIAVLLCVALWLVLLLLACGSDSPTNTPTSSPSFQIADSSKIDSLLRDLLAEYQIGGIQATRDYAHNKGLLDDQDRVRFGLTLSEASAIPTVTVKLQQMGGEVYQNYGNQLAVAVNLAKFTGYVNTVSGTTTNRDFLEELAALKEVRELRVLLGPTLDWSGINPLTSVSTLSLVGSLNEGVAVIGADKWQAAGFKGRGIKVGIIDGGFKDYRAGLGSSLPPAGQITFRSFGFGGSEGSETHGVAVAEIVHSLAPEASLFLAPIENEIGFAQAVDWLLENKVQIIQVSLGWAGLFQGDGSSKMAQQLERARRQGALPVVSVGNYGQSHYTAQLNAEANGIQHFGPNQRLTLKLTATSSSAWVSLRWNEKWEQPQTNLDLYLLDANQQPFASSRNEQGSSSPKPPTELIPFRTTPGQVFYLQIRVVGKLANPLPKFDLFAYNASLEESTPEGSVATPADAQGIISAGAVNWRDNKLEDYSSRGPTTDGRAKPELTGPSRVTTQTLGSERTFAGTSAAAPQISGTAALLWSAAPTLTTDEIAHYLTLNALRPATVPVVRNPASGFGRVQLGPVSAAQRGPLELLGALPIGPPFQDNFSVLNSGLPDNMLGYYGKLPEGLNAYFIQAGEPGQANWDTYLQKNFEEFRADFEAAPLQVDPAIFYGLTFWQQAPQDYYTFLVSGDRYALLKRKETGWVALMDWSQDVALNPKTLPNNRQHLSVEATATYIRLRVGETVLRTIALKDIRPGGRLGFTAGLFKGGQSGGSAAFAMFSNLSVTPLTTR